jgi:hypothetical protein
VGIPSYTGARSVTPAEPLVDSSAYIGTILAAFIIFGIILLNFQNILFFKTFFKTSCGKRLIANISRSVVSNR